MIRRAAALLLPLALAAPVLIAPALAEERLADPVTASAVLRGTDGTPFGKVVLEQTPSGVLVTAALTGLPPGVHGFHLHAIGKCEPDFKAAGGHFAGLGGAHGFLDGEGPHGGDMPNLHVPETGAITVEVLNTGISLDGDDAALLLDEDGAAVVIHSGPDDYMSQPAGAAGDRIACGVVEKTDIKGGAAK